MPPSSLAVQLVCFDLGGVVFRVCRDLVEGCAAAGMDLRNDVDALAAVGDAWVVLNHEYQCGQFSVEVFAERLCRLIDGLYTADEIVRIHAAWILGEYEGIGAVVQGIHDRGLETAVLSNTCGAHWTLLEQYPTFRALRNRVGSHQLGRCKPDPLTYRVIEERSGRSGSEILFFDDLPENIEAAQALGWGAERIDPDGSPPAQIMRVLEQLGA